MHPRIKVTTVSVVLCPNRKVEISTLAMGRYLPEQDLEKGIISLKSNYANARNAENVRTFYNKVGIRVHSECSNRLLSVNVFSTGAIQIAGIKDSRNEIQYMKKKMCDIMNSCSGPITPEKITRHPIYGFYTHKDVIYGRPLSSEGGSNTLFPVGIFRRFEETDYLRLHDVEMKIVNDGHGRVFFTPLHRRRKTPINGRFDYLGRRMEDGGGFSVGGFSDDVDEFEYRYSACNRPISSSMLTHKISLMNAGFNLGGRTHLADLSVALRTLGYFVSYDPNIYRDINAKFMKNSKSIGTALITSTGYTRLFGFKTHSSIQNAANELKKAASPFIQLQ